MVSESLIGQLFSKASRLALDEHAGKEDYSSQGVIELGDFRIDMNRRIVTVHGDDLDLSSEEFDVLLFLIRHPQRLITPQTVLMTTATSENPRQTEFLRVLLSLRKKLEAAGAGQHYLRTEPWVVYKFDPAPSSAKQQKDSRVV